MKLNEDLYAIVDQDGYVLGDGECSAISRSKPDDDEVRWVAKYCDVPATVVRVKLVLLDDQA